MTLDRGKAGREVGLENADPGKDAGEKEQGLHVGERSEDALRESAGR